MIHREGIKIVLYSGILFTAILLVAFILFSFWPAMIIGICLLGGWIFLLRFFRDPHRSISYRPGLIYAPADGKIVVLERTMEEEYLNEEMIQVSIFMSVWNVHINWYPAAGELGYVKYHPGKYLVARHPKSSRLNERNSLGITLDNGKRILITQIAGAVARRIISYARPGARVKAGEEMGFIRFGSRVDVFLPPDATINVKKGERCRGCKTILAELNAG